VRGCCICGWLGGLGTGSTGFVARDGMSMLMMVALSRSLAAHLGILRLVRGRWNIVKVMLSMVMMVVVVVMMMILLLLEVGEVIGLGTRSSRWCSVLMLMITRLMLMVMELLMMMMRLTRVILDRLRADLCC